MHLHLSTSNVWILVFGLALVFVHAVASSRLAPLIAGLFAGRPRRLRGVASVIKQR